MKQFPTCPLCGSRLRFSEEWFCPRSGFRFQVDRGRVGPPLWGGAAVPTEEGVSEFDRSLQDAFMRHLQEGGWTREDYEKLSDQGKQMLFQRWRETVGV